MPGRVVFVDGMPVGDLDGPGTADALARSQSALVAAEVAQVELVAHWADLHGEPCRPARAGAEGGGRRPPGTGRSVAMGGSGTPRVGEFAAAELGVVLGMTTTAAQWLMRDVLDLRHRHPLLWDAVVSGRARFWQARQVSRIAHNAGLDREQARSVDARTVPHLGTVPWGRMIGLVEAAVIAADPEAAERRRLERAVQRFVHVGASDHGGFKTLYARLEAGDAIRLAGMCERIAEILAEQGDADPVAVRRSKALGWLGTPLRAAALLKAAADAHTAARADPHADSGTAPSEPPEDPEEVDRSRWPETLVIDPSVDLARFLPRSTLYVHMSLEQFHRQTRGAVRVEDLGPVTIEHAVDLLLHTRVRVVPVVDLNETWAVDGYQVPVRIRERVELRYPAEVFPFGTAASRRADKDHVVPYAPGAPPGQTSTENLAPLGRHHHRVKTHATGWLHRQPEPGVHYWRTPAGHWARVDHRGSHNLGRELPPADRTLLDETASPTERAYASIVAAAW